MEYPTERKLDGVFFRVNRDGGWTNVCWTDLTDEERAHVSEGRSEAWWKFMCEILVDVLADLSGGLVDYDGPTSDVDAYKRLCMAVTSAIRTLGDAYDAVASMVDEPW